MSEHADFARLRLRCSHNNPLKYTKLIVVLEICVGSCLNGREWGSDGNGGLVDLSGECMVKGLQKGCGRVVGVYCPVAACFCMRRQVSCSIKTFV